MAAVDQGWKGEALNANGMILRIFGGYPYEWIRGEDAPNPLSVECIWAGIGKPIKVIPCETMM